MANHRQAKLNLKCGAVFTLLAMVFAFHVPASLAELPPSAYKQMQKNGVGEASK